MIQMIKKVIVCMVCAMITCVWVSGCGDYTKENIDISEENEVSEKNNIIDGFERAKYERFNSYASENGLADTPIYIEGKVLNQTKTEEDSEFPMVNFVVEQADGNRWLASIISDVEIKDIEGENVRVFGTYTGFSDVFNLPAMAVVATEVESYEKARIEVEKDGEYTDVWNFYYDYFSFEIGNSEEDLDEIETNELAELEKDLVLGKSISGEYAVNNLIYKYNQLAEYPIDSKTILNINEVDRPIGRLTYTFENGVYVIAQYNDYNETLFIDYQEEAIDDSSIYPIFRDFIKTVNNDISKETIENAWAELQTGNYKNYTEYDLNGIKCTYSTQNLVNGEVRYYIKTSYQT